MRGGRIESRRLATDGAIVAAVVEERARSVLDVGCGEGWLSRALSERGVRVVDGLLTGLHEPEASHLLMLEAVAGREAVARGYEEALDGRYLWHEFGDVHLVLPPEGPHTERCVSNCA